jgi:hypothetical protein
VAPSQRAASAREYSLDLSAALQSQRVNPVEHLWEEVREKYMHNRVFPSLEDLIEVLSQALTDLAQDKQRLCSMMFFPHFRVGG